MAHPLLTVRPVPPEEHAELDRLSHRTCDARFRSRAQMILLAIEEQLIACEIAAIVRQSEQTVRNWIKRGGAEGTEGLKDRPRPRDPVKVTPAYRERLLHVVQRRPRAIELPYSLWSLQRLSDFMADETGIRLSHEGVRLVLKAEDIVLSRPQHKITSRDPEYELKKDHRAPTRPPERGGNASTTPTNSTSAGSRRSRPCGRPKADKS